MAISNISARNNPVLQQVALGYQHDADMFIAQKILPEIKVEKLTGDLKTYGKDHLRIINTIAENGETIMLTHTVTHAQQWNIHNHELTAFMSERDADQLGPDQAKADFTEMNMETLLISRENALAAFATNLSNYGANNKQSNSTTSLWSDFINSTPRQDIITMNEAVRKTCGRYPNRVIVSPTVVNYMVNHPQLRDAVMHIGESVLSLDKLKTILFPTYAAADCEILVAMAQYNSAAKGQTAVMTDIWNDVIIFAYVNPAPNPRQHQTSFGYSFSRGKGSAVQVIPWKQQYSRENEFYITDRWEYDDVIIAAGSGSTIDAAAIISPVV